MRSPPDTLSAESTPDRAEQILDAAFRVFARLGFTSARMEDVALAVAGWLPRPTWALGLPIAFGLVGYLVVAIFPLVSALAPRRHLSPWDGAFGGEPLLHTTAAWRFLVLAAVALALVAVGAVGFGRRDIRAG